TNARLHQKRPGDAAQGAKRSVDEQNGQKTFPAHIQKRRADGGEAVMADEPQPKDEARPQRHETERLDGSLLGRNRRCSGAAGGQSRASIAVVGNTDLSAIRLAVTLATDALFVVDDFLVRTTGP